MEHFAKLATSTVAGCLVKGGISLAGHSIDWVWALLIGLTVVYGGWLIITGDIID